MTNPKLHLLDLGHRLNRFIMFKTTRAISSFSLISCKSHAIIFHSHVLILAKANLSGKHLILICRHQEMENLSYLLSVGPKGKMPLLLKKLPNFSLNLSGFNLGLTGTSVSPLN